MIIFVFCVQTTELKRIIHKSVATLPYFSISATPHTHTERKREENWHLIIIKCTRYSYILIWQSALQRETKNKTYFWLHFSVYDHIEYPRKGGGGIKYNCTLIQNWRRYSSQVELLGWSLLIPMQGIQVFVKDQPQHTFRYFACFLYIISAKLYCYWDWDWDWEWDWRVFCSVAFGIVVAQRRRLSSHLLALCLSVLGPGPGLGRGASAAGSRVSC